MAFGERLLLCVGAAQATLGVWRRGRLTRCETFTDDADGLRRFAQTLAAGPRVPVHALVDAVEEDYRSELLPHSSGRERSAMVQRRLRQLYRNSPFNAAVLQGRDNEGRRDDRYLFAALNNADLFLPWLEAIEEARLPFAGLYLLPLVMPGLARQLLPNAPPTLVVTLTSSGLRQSFVDAGQLRVSRLTPLPARDEAGRIGALVEEISNTRLYLEALKLCTQDEPLPVALIDTDDSLRPAVAAIERQGNNLRCARFDVAALAAKLPLEPTLLRATPDALALTLLGLRTPGVNLAPDTVLRRFRVLNTQRAMYAATGIVALLGIAFAAANIVEYQQAIGQIAEQKAETANWQERYAAAARQFPESPAPLTTLRSTVDAAGEIARQTRTPERAWAVVGAALSAQPEIGLERLVWRHGAPLSEADGPAGGSARPAQAAPARVESAAIEAEIIGFSGDLRGAVASIEALALRLRSDPRVQSATVTRLPVNLNPGASLSGTTEERIDRAPSAEFRIVIVLRPEAT
jgi:hypothetical protein